jgi:hypothetical protein
VSGPRDKRFPPSKILRISRERVIRATLTSPVRPWSGVFSPWPDGA